ncbi:MAG: DUF3298 and DUF4163 domain-containing protein [Acidobacteria bacterium]|nr:DUF3298 and DUF4163 domain-containing protein [Acidobacteriota bacterium]
MKKIVSTLISMTLTLSVFNFAQANAVGASTNSGLASAQVRVASIRFAPRLIRDANRKLRYTIKAKYPQAIGAKDARTQKLNQTIRDLITAQVNDFKKDFQPPEERMGTAGSYLETGYVVKLAASDLVSIDFGVDSYFEGAAHGSHSTVGFNFDLKSGKMLSMSDLFKSNSKYLELISSYSIKSLKKALGPDPDMEWIQKGAEASEENYRSWTITPKGLTVTFDQYQVASYAQGPQEVVIPYSVLKNVIDPSGPLARMIR